MRAQTEQTYKERILRLHQTDAGLYGEWLPRSGREPADMHAFVIYRNGPQDTAPEDLVTDIYVPPRPR
jgi:AraC family transcriptional regulator